MTITTTTGTLLANFAARGNLKALRDILLEYVSMFGSLTAGTVTASQAVVVSATKTIGSFLSVTATTFIGNLSAPAGTATVAPITLTTGTNLTTAAAGVTEYDGSVFYDTAVASSRQVRDTEQFCCLTANYTMTDSASAQKCFNSSTNGAITLAATTSYFFEAVYKISNTGTTSHTWSTLFGGTATFTSIAYEALARTGTTSGVTITAMSDLQVAVATAVPVTAASTSATEFVTIMIRGIMRVNGAGTVIPQVQASAQPGLSGTPGITMLAGSYFRAWPVGSNTVATVGNWS